MENDEQIGMGGIALLLGGLILVCVLGVIGLGLYTTQADDQPVSVSETEPTPRGDALARIYFETGSAQLPEESGGAIQSIKEKMSANTSLKVLISGFHDPSGDPAKNAELAYQRADAARQELINAGVASERIILRKPEQIPGTEDMQEARRVDIHVQ